MQILGLGLANLVHSSHGVKFALTASNRQAQEPLNPHGFRTYKRGREKIINPFAAITSVFGDATHGIAGGMSSEFAIVVA